MTIKLSSQYLENKDATSILYKQYNTGPHDKYPTFSICFQGNQFHWYNELEIFRAFGVPVLEYVRILSGKSATRYEYNLTSRLYKRFPAYMDLTLNANFDKFHIQISDFVRKSEFVNEQNKEVFNYGMDIYNSSPQPAFYIGYQTPDMICFTRNSNDPIGAIRLYDNLSLNRSILTASCTRMWIFHSSFITPSI